MRSDRANDTRLTVPRRFRSVGPVTSGQKRPASGIGALLLVAALLACRAKTPPPAPDSEPILAPGASSRVGAKPRVIDGFLGLKFGQRLDAVRKSATLKERCKTEVQLGQLRKTFPGQSFDQEYLFCYATIAGQQANLHIYFDRGSALYRLCFSFDDRKGSKVRRLTASQGEQLVAELRRILEPAYGTPVDRSQERPSGREADLSWESQAGSLRRKAVIRIRIGVEPTAPQQVDWIDRAREAALRSRIRQERTAEQQLKGL